MRRGWRDTGMKSSRSSPSECPSVHNNSSGECHVSGECRVSGVMWWVSVLCHVSGVMCRVSCVG